MQYSTKVLVAFLNNLAALANEAAEQLKKEADNERTPAPKKEKAKKANPAPVVEEEVEDEDEPEGPKLIKDKNLLISRVQKMIPGGFLKKEDVRLALDSVGAKNLAVLEDEHLDLVWQHFQKAWKAFCAENKRSK